MKIIIVENYDELSKKAFEVMKAIVTSKKDVVLGLATGSSPVGLYQLMIEDYKAGNTDYSNAKSFNLDEYVGLKKEHPQSYFSFMHDNLFHGINIPKENINIPLGDTSDLEKSCKDYDARIEKEEVDIQVLGIGANGHIGFNEPGTSFDTKTHIVKLAEKTRIDNTRFFSDISEVPKEAITMGISTIMKAKKILLIASGSNKKDAVARMIEGEIKEDCPATILQKHQDCIVILDKEAASGLKNKY